MIRCRDLLDDDATLEAYCRKCGKITLIPGKLLVRRYGADTSIVDLIARLRCERDGMLADASIIFDAPEVAHEARARRLPPHRPLRTSRNDG